MDKNAIKKYAVWARRELISRVSQKALQYGITDKDIVPATATSVNGVVLSAEEQKQRKALIERINSKGYEQVMEEVAYTWFNRFIALRFMEVNNGFTTGDNNQFLRFWYEVNRERISLSSGSHEEALASGKTWFAYNKGGAFRKWYGNNDYVINWRNNGQAVKAYGHLVPRSMQYQFKKSIASYFSTDYMEWFATDIGDWNMEITNAEGVAYKFRGSLCCDIEVDGVDLSDMIRDALGMDDLYVFDGNHKPDRVDRVTVDYHRITKIKPRQSFSETAEYVTWDYTERLVIDRESETIEHIQNIGSGCVVSRKYYIQGGVEGLLDDIDADDLFGKIEGDPDDVVENPLETKDYTIAVDFKKGPQRVIQGTYDKKALPEFWGDFADEMWNFMRFYGWGEMLDPAVYEKVKRRKNDYIYCSVEFDEGYKSYYYIADEDDISVGDHVIVPVGKDNHHSVAEVVKVEYFAEEDVPLPLDRTKHIIRKCTDEDFDPPM